MEFKNEFEWTYANMIEYDIYTTFKKYQNTKHGYFLLLLLLRSLHKKKNIEKNAYVVTKSKPLKRFVVNHSIIFLFLIIYHVQ